MMIMRIMVIIMIMMDLWNSLEDFKLQVVMMIIMRIVVIIMIMMGLVEQLLEDFKLQVMLIIMMTRIAGHHDHD